jgi:hypothetical protein
MHPRAELNFQNLDRSNTFFYGRRDYKELLGCSFWLFGLVECLLARFSQDLRNPISTLCIKKKSSFVDL